MPIVDDFTHPHAPIGYDRLRGYPPAIARQLGQRLVEIVGRGARVVELGVGTGRIAAPLQQAGARVVGVDLSAAMLGGWQRKQNKAQAVQGDVSNLPFATHTFDAALAVHVLHLVSDPQPVIGEIRRVLRPSAPLLLGTDWHSPDALYSRIRDQWRAFVATLQIERRAKPANALDVSHLLRDTGAQSEPETILLEWTDVVTPAAEIDRIATRQPPESWALPDDLLQRSVAQLNDWLFHAGVDPNQTELVTRQFRLTAVRWTNGIGRG